MFIKRNKECNTIQVLFLHNRLFKKTKKVKSFKKGILYLYLKKLLSKIDTRQLLSADKIEICFGNSLNLKKRELCHQTSTIMNILKILNRVLL